MRKGSTVFILVHIILIRCLLINAFDQLFAMKAEECANTKEFEQKAVNKVVCQECAICINSSFR